MSHRTDPLPPLEGLPRIVREYQHHWEQMTPEDARLLPPPGHRRSGEAHQARLEGSARLTHMRAPAGRRRTVNPPVAPIGRCIRGLRCGGKIDIAPL